MMSLITPLISFHSTAIKKTNKKHPDFDRVFTTHLGKRQKREALAHTFFNRLGALEGENLPRQFLALRQ